MEKVSYLKQQINEKSYKKQRLIQEIQVKRKMADNLRKQRDDLNSTVKELSNQAKIHLEKRDKINLNIQELKAKRAEIGKKIIPHAKKIRDEKEERKKLNYLAYGTLETLQKEFDASLKTLFEYDLSLRDEAIMVEMIHDYHKRYMLKKDAQLLHKEIHEEWQGIKEIEGDIDNITQQIIKLASESQEEHNNAMEIFDRKEEARRESDEVHKQFIILAKEIKDVQNEINRCKEDADSQRNEIFPLTKKLEKLKITRWEEQKLEKLKEAKTKMKSTGKIDLEDLRVLMESGALKFDKKKKSNQESSEHS